MNPRVEMNDDEHQVELDDMMISTMWDEDDDEEENEDDNDDDDDSFDFGALETVAAQDESDDNAQLQSKSTSKTIWKMRQNNGAQLCRKVPLAQSGFNEWVGANVSLLLVRNKHLMRRSDLIDAVRNQWKSVDADTQALFARLHQREMRAKHHNRANSSNLCK
jgi:hypothetical protein